MALSAPHARRGGRRRGRGTAPESPRKTLRPCSRGARGDRYALRVKVRPLLVLTPLAAALVAWFMTRMWFGHDPTVWRVSTLLGGWAPVLAAALLTYLRREGHREGSVGAAWLARALGVHCALLWMVGVSDWLRGPPHAPPAWNIDSGTPLVFLAFALCFALCAPLVHRLAELATARARPPLRRVEAPAAWHYRAAPSRAGIGPARMVLADRPWVPSATCALAFGGALAAPCSPAVSALAAAGIMGAVSSRHTVLPAVAGLVLLSARGAMAFGGSDALAMRWPALLVASLWTYALVGPRMTTRRTGGEVLAEAGAARPRALGR